MSSDINYTPTADHRPATFEALRAAGWTESRADHFQLRIDETRFLDLLRLIADGYRLFIVEESRYGPDRVCLLDCVTSMDQLDALVAAITKPNVGAKS